MKQDPNAVIERLRTEALTYTSSREQFIRAGRETRQLAALIAEKYCAGIVSAVSIIGGPSAAHALLDDVHRELARLDPEWLANVARRRNARPADLCFPSPSSHS